MRTLAIVTALLLAAAGQQPTMPPPGNPDHVEPPPGNGEPDGTWTRQEDNARCRAACHPTHCHCLSDCETS